MWRKDAPPQNARSTCVSPVFAFFFPENLKNRIAKEKRRVILVFTPKKPGVSSLEIEQRNEMCGSVPVTRDGLVNK